MRSLRTAMLALACVIGLAGHLAAQAQEFRLGDIEIKQPWSRATPQGSKVGAGYLSITNRGANPDRLVAVSTAAAGTVELHEMAMKGGVMTMRPLPDGITIEPGKTVMLRPGGLHIMFMNLPGPLRQGEKFTAQLAFEKAGKIEVTFDVQPIGAREAPSH